MKNTILQSVKVIVLGLILSAGIAFAQTWTGPTSAPPGGNVAAPINVSSTSQIKSGALGTGPLAVFGNSALYGDVSILGSSISNNTNIGFLEKSGLLKKVFAQAEQPTSDLFVSGEVTVGGLASATAGAQVCASTTGQLTLCTVSPTTPTPPTPSGSVTFPGTPSPWSVPAGVTSITIEAWGGGGGAGGGGGSHLNNTTALGGGGGGAGGHSKIINMPVTEFELFTVALGAGGSGGSGGSVGPGFGGTGGGGNNGGTTNITRNSNGSLILTAAGGARGTGGDGSSSNPAYVGQGGAGGAGNGLGGSGGSGSDGGIGNIGQGGAGGSAHNGGAGGGGGAAGNNSLGGEGLNGSTPGAGGGGGGGGNGSAANNYSGNSGGDGAQGRVTITW